MISLAGNFRVVNVLLIIGFTLLHIVAGRAQSAGAIDTSFDPGTGANVDIFTDASLQPDGKIIIGGVFTSYNGTARNGIARLNADGSLDTSFDPGTGPGDVWTTGLQPDGKIIISGFFTSYNGTTRNRIARLNANGSLDTSFDPGTGANNFIRATSLQPDGKIIIGGGFNSYNGTARGGIARLNADGSLDTSFDPGTGVNNIVYTTSLQPDGKIIIGGIFTSYNGTARNNIARLNANGSLDTSFNPVTGANNQVSTFSLQPDGKIIIGGSFTSYNGTARGGIARLNADGSLDTSFAPGTGTTIEIRTTRLLPDGKIIIGGNFTSYNGTARNRIARLNADGSLDTSFDPGTGANNWVSTIILQPDGKIIIGGGFTSYNGTARNRIARISLGGIPYYWIGDGGNWKNASHWSLTSGGSSAGSIPGIDDNVFFDASSFTLPGQVVFILDDGSTQGVVFNTLDWRGVTNNPTFQIKRDTSDYVYNECYGSLYFSDNMILDFDGAEFYMASSSNYEFDTRGHNMGQNCWLWFNSQAAVTGNILSNINHAWIYSNKGIVNFNGHSFFGINNSNNVENQNYPTIWLANGAATLNISNSLIDVGTILFGTGSTLIDDNATLRIRNRFNASNHNFNYVVFDSVSWNGSGANTFQNLEILSGSVVKFASAVTQTINNLVVNSTRQIPVYVSSTSPGNPATIQKSSGTVDINWVHLQDITATGGATFNAHGAWNDGNITGWNFKADSLDRVALDALYASTNGSSWTNSSIWQSGSSDSRIVMDNGATASGGRVTSLLLSGNNLVGSIPDEITDLEQLELLDLSNNSISSIPDLTIMPSLTTLNVSGNNFDFEDLEKNAAIIVDDGIGFYQDQAPVSMPSYNEIPVNSDTTMTIATGGGSNSYQWKFKGKADQNYSNIGTNSNTYAIASINRSSMGDYMLEITNPSVPGLVLTSAVHSIAATADISGTLFHDTAMPATSGTVLLLRVTSVGSYDTIGIEVVNGSGAYLFDNAVLDDYLINGWADTLLYEKSIPTWYQQTIYWEDADTLVLENNETGLDIVSTERPNHPIAGQGSISGIVYEAETNPEGKGNVAGDRVAKAATTVRRVERGGREDEETLTLIDYLFTNDDGEFSFTKLDGGEEYRLNIQYPGYPMDENSFITIPVGTTLFDRQVGVEAEVKNGKISVRKLVITGWEEQPQFGLQAYPNPTVDYIYVKNYSGEVALEFQLLDGSGRSINVPSEWNSSDKRWELDIRAIETGAFILQVKQKNRTDILKVIVR